MPNEEKSAQTTEQQEDISTAIQTADHADGSEDNTAKINDAAFADGDKGDGKGAEAPDNASSSNEETEKAEEKTRQKEINAENARRRREAARQAELRAERERTIIDVLGGINPYTNEPMKDSADVEEYLTMKDIEREGLDPVADFARWKKKQDRDKAERLKTQEDEKEWYRTDRENFQKAYPGVNISKLADDGQFASFAAGKVGKIPLAELYRDFLENKKAIISEYKEQVAREKANEKASPGSLSGANAGASGTFTPEEVRKMSRADIRQNLDKIRESMLGWK